MACSAHCFNPYWDRWSDIDIGQPTRYSGTRGIQVRSFKSHPRKHFWHHVSMDLLPECISECQDSRPNAGVTGNSLQLEIDLKSGFQNQNLYG